MATTQTSQHSRTILLVEADVVIRFGLAQHLRGCGHAVIEVVSSAEARAVLVSGLKPHVMLADASLAGDDNGFELAQWVRRHRKSIEVILTGTLSHKVQAVCELCAGDDQRAVQASELAKHIQAMMAERKRRLRTQPKPAPITAPRRKRT